MFRSQAIRKQTEFFFGSHRRARESLRSQRLCRIAPLEERSLLTVFPAETANDSCNDMLQTSGSINSALFTYAKNSIQNEWNASKQSISAYGTFQVGWRTEMQSSVPAGSTAAQMWQSEVQRTTSLVATRNDYLTRLDTAFGSYMDDMFDSLDTLAQSQLDAQIARNNAEFDASRTLAAAQLDARFARDRSSLSDLLNVQKDGISSELITVRDKALAEKNAAASKVTILIRQLEELGDGSNSDPDDPDNSNTSNLGDWTNRLNTATSANNLNTINEQATSAANTASAAADAAQLARDAQNSVSAASGQADTDCVHEIGQASAQSIYDAAMAAANNTYTTSLMSSATSFLDATNASFETCSEYVSSLTCLYATAITAIDNGGTIGNNYFSNPTEDAEVCFVAGTPILMADGTSKPIEEIRPGDMVLSVDHNDPEKDTPKPARVTRFFDNGLKSVVKLTFENQETGEQFEVVCTSSHRFYVKNKGWINAEALQTGEQCISAKETEITFISREELKDAQHVYNFEVDRKHTYFVGAGHEWAVLVHNVCWGWNTVTGFLSAFVDELGPAYVRNADNIQGTLDVAGMVPVIGIAADVSNAIIYTVRGKLDDAGMCAIGLIPVLGDAAQAGKLVNKARKAIDAGTEILEHSDDIKDSAKLVINLSGQSHHPISKQIRKSLDTVDVSNISKNLKDKYRKFTTQAGDIMDHKGYQQWHRELDDEISNWITQQGKELTDERLIQYLKDVYSRPELSNKFPNFGKDIADWFNSLGK